MSISSTASNSEPIASLIRSAGGTDKGAKRDYNADAFTSIESSHFKVFLVADGIGGPNKGGIASNLALSTVKDVLKNRKRVNLSDLRDAVREANEVIFKKGSNEPELGGMGTTLVGIAFVDSRAYIVNVGNSRAYRIRGAKISRLTIDTTVAQLLQEGNGSLGEDAAKATASHMLTRCLGTKDRVEIDGAPLPEQPQVGDTYLLCTDGLYDLVLEKELVDAFASRELDEAVEYLIALANQRGGHDNITLCVVSVAGADTRKAEPEQKQKGKGTVSLSKELAAELPIPPEAAQSRSLFSPPTAPPQEEDKSKDSADLLAAMLEKKRKEIREKLLAKSKGETPSEAPSTRADEDGQKQKESVNKDLESLKRALSSIQSKGEAEKQESAQSEKKDPHAELKARIAALSERVAAEKEKALAELSKKRAATEEAQAVRSQEGREIPAKTPGDAVPLRRTLDPKGPGRQIPDLDKRGLDKGKTPPPGGKRPLLAPPPSKRRSFGSRLGVALVVGLVVGGIIASQLTSFDTTQISQNLLGVKESPKPASPQTSKAAPSSPRADEIEATRLFAQKLTDAELADVLRLTREAADQNAREAARLAKGIPVRDAFELAPEGISYIRHPGHKMMFLEVYSAIREAVAASDKRLETITQRQERIGQVLTRLSETIELSKSMVKPEEIAQSSNGIVVSQAKDEKATAAQ